MSEEWETGYATPEEASFGDIPPQFVTVNCVRDKGRWHFESGFPFSAGAPEEVLEEARALGWTGHQL